jgi:hypothetical protein
MSSEKDSLRERLKKQGPLEALFELAKAIWEKWIWPYMGAAIQPIWLGVAAVGTGFYLWFSGLDPLSKWTLSIVALAGSVHLANQVRTWVTTGHRKAPPIKTTSAEADKKPYVEFLLPSNWQPGFRHKTLPIDTTVGEVFAEEVVLHVIAKMRMQNVRFLISAKHRRNGQLETLAQVGSVVFTGIVQKDQEQGFVVMHRTFCNAQGEFEHPRHGGKARAPVRVENGTTFFPENQGAAFPGTIGEKYTFHVSVLHDEGSENAYFSITLEPSQIFPMSRITSMSNITPITRN